MGGYATSGGDVFTFNRSDVVAYAGVISGTGGLTKTGAGTLTLSAANTYTGGTVIAAGTLALAGTGTLGATSSLTMHGGTVLDVSGITPSATSITRLDVLGAGAALLGNGKILDISGKKTFFNIGGAAPGETVLYAGRALKVDGAELELAPDGLSSIRLDEDEHVTLIDSPLGEFAALSSPGVVGRRIYEVRQEGAGENVTLNVAAILNFALYGVYPHSSGFYAQGGIGYGHAWNEYDVNMFLGGKKSGKYGSDDWSGNFELGYAAKLPCDFQIGALV